MFRFLVSWSSFVSQKTCWGWQYSASLIFSSEAAAEAPVSPERGALCNERRALCTKPRCPLQRNPMPFAENNVPFALSPSALCCNLHVLIISWVSDPSFLLLSRLIFFTCLADYTRAIALLGSWPEWNLIKNTSDYFSELFEAFAPILTNASHQHQVSIISLKDVKRQDPREN